MKNRIMLAVLLAAFAASVNAQGVLTSSDGKPVTDGFGRVVTCPGIGTESAGTAN